MPGPEGFFPGAHCIVTRRSMLITSPVSVFYVLADWVHVCIKKAIHMQAHTHIHTHRHTHKHTQHTHKGFADTWLLTNCLHTSLGANALSQIIQHFSHGEHLHNSLPVGATLKVSFC